MTDQQFLSFEQLKLHIDHSLQGKTFNKVYTFSDNAVLAALITNMLNAKLYIIENINQIESDSLFVKDYLTDSDIEAIQSIGKQFDTFTVFPNKELSNNHSLIINNGINICIKKILMPWDNRKLTPKYQLRELFGDSISLDFKDYAVFENKLLRDEVIWKYPQYKNLDYELFTLGDEFKESSGLYVGDLDDYAINNNSIITKKVEFIARSGASIYFDSNVNQAIIISKKVYPVRVALFSGTKLHEIIAKDVEIN